ncbi:DNA-binding transcriptional LysR family regulator [Hamadaea flava]|uniref:LysR family transcriptional regulator n=1 Tax=Hamadaea flava TaxID=1742688 RepID=A0ABV8LPL5_9ACTN|nr:LysR family transcriptional regulator [Hamadaea flava]MCP2324199.1 DNA-binding transcriptional LysR family regulator [Hamadaea flava]
MAHDLETGLLRAFLTAARARSISRAAASLGHSQPALSQQLRKLERLVGEPLLHRSATGVALTRAGETLLPYAERILALSAQALQAPRQALTGHCGVGLIEDLAAAPLPQALADFGRIHPGATLELVSAPGPAMRDAFATGRVQLALCDPVHLPEPPRWTVRLPLAWAAGPGVDLTVDPLPLVLFSQPCNWRPLLLDAIEAADRTWRIAFESTSLAGVKAAVRAGLGVAALLPVNLDPGTAVAGLPDLPDVELGLVRRSGTEGDLLIDAVEAVLRSLV